LRRIDSCFTQLKAQGPSRTCNESKEELSTERLNRRCKVSVLSDDRLRWEKARVYSKQVRTSIFSLKPRDSKS